MWSPDFVKAAALLLYILLISSVSECIYASSTGTAPVQVAIAATGKEMLYWVRLNYINHVQMILLAWLWPGSLLNRQTPQKFIMACRDRGSLTVQKALSQSLWTRSWLVAVYATSIGSTLLDSFPSASTVSEGICFEGYKTVGIAAEGSDSAKCKLCLKVFWSPLEYRTVS